MQRHNIDLAGTKKWTSSTWTLQSTWTHRVIQWQWIWRAVTMKFVSKVPAHIAICLSVEHLWSKKVFVECVCISIRWPFLSLPPPKPWKMLIFLIIHLFLLLFISTKPTKLHTIEQHWLRDRIQVIDLDTTWPKKK